VPLLAKEGRQERRASPCSLPGWSLRGCLFWSGRFFRVSGDQFLSFLGGVRVCLCTTLSSPFNEMIHSSPVCSKNVPSSVISMPIRAEPFSPLSEIDS
jgi:hypothetical protein